MTIPRGRLNPSSLMELLHALLLKLPTAKLALRFATGDVLEVFTRAVLSKGWLDPARIRILEDVVATGG